MKRVVITGLGAVTPIGLTVEDIWRSLTNGISGVGPITQFDAARFPVRIAAEVKGFDPRNYMDFKQARHSPRSAHFALAAARMALQDARVQVERAGESVGVVMNTGAGGIGEQETATRILIEKGPSRVGPFVVPSVMPNAVACAVSIAVGARGPVITSTSACAGGTQALLQAFHLLREGEADVVIAGGTDATITPVTLASLANAGALSCRNDEPARASRPFDRDRDGFVMGEGAIAMILESEEHAQKRAAPICAEIAGGALTADAYHITAPDPKGDGAIRAMRRTLQSSQIRPDQVDVVFAHGTSTPLNDRVETEALKAVFGMHAHRLAVSATKSMAGHLLGAAGALSALAATLALREGVVPPTINLESVDPVCDLDYVPNTARRMPIRSVMVNAFGFGGQNAVVLLRRYPD